MTKLKVVCGIALLLLAGSNLIYMTVRDAAVILSFYESQHVAQHLPLIASQFPQR